MLELKKYTGVIFQELKSDAKFEEKLTCSLKKSHEKFDKFSPEHLKVSKFGL